MPHIFNTLLWVLIHVSYPNSVNQNDNIEIREIKGHKIENSATKHDTTEAYVNKQ